MRRMLPRVFYGWVVVAVSVVILLIVWGSQYSFGVFFKPLSAEFGWSRATTSLAYSLYMVIHGLAQPASGIVSDRWGPRVPVLFCGVVMGVGYFLMSGVSQLWQLYLYYGAVIAISMTFAYVPLSSTITRWFTARRGLALGITATGVGLATAVMAPVAQALISAFGWRNSYQILAGLLAFVVAPLGLLLVASPEKKGLRPYGEKAGTATEAPGPSGRVTTVNVARAVRTQAFWFVTAVFFVSQLIDQVVLVHIVPHVTDMGMSAAAGASVLSLVGLSSVVGRILSGLMMDRMGTRRTLTLVMSIATVALFLLSWITDTRLFYVFAVVFGLGYGGAVPLHPALLGQYFGLKYLGTIYGAMLVVVNLGGALGPYAAGHIYDVTGQYQLAFLGAGVVAVIGVLFSFMLGPPTTIAEAPAKTPPRAVHR